MIEDAVLRVLSRIEHQLALIIGRLDELEARADVRDAIALGETPPANGLPLEAVKARILAARREPR